MLEDIIESELGTRYVDPFLSDSDTTQTRIRTWFTRQRNRYHRNFSPEVKTEVSDLKIDATNLLEAFKDNSQPTCEELKEVQLTTLEDSKNYTKKGSDKRAVIKLVPILSTLFIHVDCLISSVVAVVSPSFVLDDVYETF